MLNSSSSVATLAAMSRMQRSTTPVRPQAILEEANQRAWRDRAILLVAIVCAFERALQYAAAQATSSSRHWLWAR